LVPRLAAADASFWRKDLIFGTWHNRDAPFATAVEECRHGPHAILVERKFGVVVSAPLL
jgi:hypothetical protein